MGFWVRRARGSKVDLQPVLRCVAAFRPPVLALRGVLRGAPPSAARLRRDGSRKRKRQKIATSQEQRLLPRVTRVQRSRIAANISSMAALIFESLPAMPHDLASRLNQPAEHGLHLGVLASVSGRRAASRTGRGAMIGDLPRDGGLELFKLFNRSRRSSSTIRAVGAALPAACAAIGAISSSLDGSPGASRILRRPEKSTPPSRIATT
jgi:hypothetical protein